MTYKLVPFGRGVVLDGPKKRKGPTPEGRQKKALVAYLEQLPWVAKVTRHNVGFSWMGANPKTGYKGRPVRFCEPGHSDLSVEVRGSPITVWIETKAPGARPSGVKQKAHWEEQEKFLARKRAQGHPAFFCSAGEVLRAELMRAGLQAPTALELATSMKAAGIHPSTISALMRKLRDGLFQVPLAPKKGKVVA